MSKECSVGHSAKIEIDGKVRVDGVPSRSVALLSLPPDDIIFPRPSSSLL